MRILVVDDDPAVRRSIDRALRLEGYDVVGVPSGGEALEALAQGPPDALILDLGLPDIDGLTVCRRMRSAGDDTPVLMLTARDAIDDRVQGLDAGADDYLVKPYALAELLARLRALLRRRFEGEGGLLRVGDLMLDLSTREGQRGERSFTLTRIEFDLLEMFLRHPRQVLTREVLLNRVWGFDFDSGTKSLAVYVGYLRRKLEEGGEPRCIQTVRGVGYVPAGHVTFRTRLVLATTVAVVVAVLAASLGSFLVARHTLLNAADSSLTTAAEKLLAGQEIGSTTATLGQVIDTTGGVVSGGGLPVTGQVRLVAVGLAPSFFTTVVVDGNEIREYVEHLPPGTSVPDGILAEGGALQIATLLNVDSELKKLALLLGAVAFAGVVLAIVLGWLVARTALVPLNSLTDTVEDLAETTDVTRRLSPGRPDELGRLRRTFNRLLEALESSRRAQSQLVLDASHELRTPLTSLRTNLEVIRRVDELSDEDRSVLVDDVLVQLQELTDIVGDLAELARGDRGPASREPLRLDLLVRDEVAVQNTHGRTKDVHFELDASPCWVVASDEGLRRAVNNLLDNARKWSPAGEAVAVECHEGAVVVRDHGPGVAEGDLPHIFDRFYHAPAARGLPGSGLGLAIVAQVVKAEGGTIVAENDPRGGARMTMRLPTVAGPDVAEVEGEAEAEAEVTRTTEVLGAAGALPPAGKAPEIGAVPGRPTDL